MEESLGMASGMEDAQLGVAERPGAYGMGAGARNRFPNEDSVGQLACGSLGCGP